MTIQKQVVHIDLTGGLDKRTDDNLTIPSKLIEADNVEFVDRNTIQSRGGQVEAGGLASADVNQPIRTFVHNNTVHVESRPNSLNGGIHRVDTVGNSPYKVENPTRLGALWTSAAFRRASAETSRITRIDRDPSPPLGYFPLVDGRFDFAVEGDYSYYVFEEESIAGGRGAVRVIVRRESSGVIVLSQQVTDSSNVLVNPRVVTSPGQPVYLYVASYTKGTKTWNLLKYAITTTAIGTAAVVTAASGGTGGNIEESDNDTCMFDCIYSLNGTRIITVLRDSTAAGDKLKFNIVNSSDGASSVDSGTYTAANRVTALCVLSTGTSTLRAHAFWAESGLLTISGVARIYSGTPAFTGASTVGTMIYGTGRLTAFYNSAFSSNIWLAVDDVGGITTTQMRGRLFVSSFTETYGSLIDTTLKQPANEHYNWFISGSPVLVQNRLYLPVQNVSAQFFGTSFLFDITEFLDSGSSDNAPTFAPVLSRLDYGECFLSTTNWGRANRVPTSVASSDRYIYYTYLKRETDLRLAGGSDETGVALVRANIDLDSQLGSVEMNGVTLLAGACPHIYDGKQWFEEGFHHPPELDSAAVVAGTGYPLPSVNGAYDVCFTVGWQDNQGNWYESAPSNVVRFTVAGVNESVPYTALTVPISYKAGYKINMYRTPLLGTDTNLYLCSSDVGSTTSFVTSDTSLVNGELLYTTGDVLPNTPAPACRQATSFQGRIALSGCGDGSRVFVSKPLQQGFGPEFVVDDASHSLRVPSELGRAVASIEMDSTLHSLCERGVCAFYGNGPSVTGTQGGFSEPAVRVTQFGMDWDSPKSAILTANGIWFKRGDQRGTQGLRLYTRQGSIAAANGAELGAEVDDLVSASAGTVVAVGPGDRNQTRFYHSAGTVLVLDNHNGQWTRWTGVGNIDACSARGPLGVSVAFHLSAYAGDQPLLRYFDNSVNTDVGNDHSTGVAYTSKVKTGWLWLAGIQGFQRVYRLGVVLETNPVQNNLEYTINGIISYKNQAVTDSFTLTSLTMNEHLLQYQKSTAIQAELKWSAIGVSSPLKLTDLTLLVGVKAGYNRLGFNRS